MKSKKSIILLALFGWINAVDAYCPSDSIYQSGMESLFPSIPSSPVISENEAARFLTQATFGPKLSEIRRLQVTGYEAWLDEQMAMPATLQETCMQAVLDDPDLPLYQNSRQEAWFLNSAEGADQLRQRMAFTLSQLFVVSDAASLGNEVMGLAKYYDYLAINAFGNFRDQMEDITKNTMMGFYLGMFKNAKANPLLGTQPDENYAREILQLFTIGLHQLNMDGTEILDIDNNPIPTYDQSDIENFARVFTGWNYAGCPQNNWDWCNPSQPEVDGYAPMEPFESYHDIGIKTLLNGQVLAANQSAQQDLTGALDNIFNHPNVPPFISKQLIQRFVTSNPSPAYVQRVAEVFVDNGSAVRGDMGAVLRAVLLDDEARNVSFLADNNYGKLKEPLIRYMGLIRAFEAVSPTGRYGNWNPEFSYLQRALGSPSVFNFYKPGFQQPGAIRDQSLVSPEFQITSETTVVSIANEMYEATLRGHHEFTHWNESMPLLQLQRELQIYNDKNALLDHLDLMLFSGHMSVNTRTVVGDLYDDLDDGSEINQLASLLYVLVLSPEYVVQK
ncbi:DUF1800 domain-containing protein [Marinicella rhabdoformis]|uniref:DUF1800 domain-containing protein n=1 Tax=Marinicella rhabdoformis TaxID=2580566 RepID=UPI0012AECC36|nr:DUF1800 domain-containing protein [Marinicella rhabdoformis]